MLYLYFIDIWNRSIGLTRLLRWSILDSFVAIYSVLFVSNCHLYSLSTSIFWLKYNINSLENTLTNHPAFSSYISYIIYSNPIWLVYYRYNVRDSRVLSLNSLQIKQPRRKSKDFFLSFFYSLSLFQHQWLLVNPECRWQNVHLFNRNIIEILLRKRFSCLNNKKKPFGSISN